MSSKIFKKNFVWVFTTYFAQGFPFTTTRTVVALFLRDMKVSLEGIGLTSLYGLPWVFKFLWSPQIDEHATKKRWMLVLQFLISCIMLVSAFIAPLSSGAEIIALLFFVNAIFAATQDIAIDGYYMEALNRDDQAKFVGYRVMAYRIAMLTASGLITTIGTTIGWFYAFFTAGILMSLSLIYHHLFLDEVEEYKKPFKHLFLFFLKLKNLIGLTLIAFFVFGLRYFYYSNYYSSLQEQYSILKQLYLSHYAGMTLLFALIFLAVFRKSIKKIIFKDPDSYYSKVFLSYIDRKNIGTILFFLIMLRIGEWMLSTMVAPFIVDLGLKVHYGWMTSIVSLPASIIGAMIGGWSIYKYGLKKVIWPFILAQNLTNVIYMFLAIYLKDYVLINTGVEQATSIGAFNIVLVSGVMATEQFAGGLGTSVLMVYLMKLCMPNYKSAHYAIGSGLMSLSGLFSGIISGFIAGSFGYAWTFGVSFVLSVPAMLVISKLPMNED